MSVATPSTFIDPKTIIVRRETRQRQANVHDFDDLKDSIVKVGVINPLVVRTIEDKPVLVAGERRLLAAISANIPLVPVRFFDSLTEEEAELVELEENVKRKELHWRDHVRSVGRLHAMYKAANKNWLVEQTCAALSLHYTHLHKILRVYESLDSPRIAHVESIEQAYNTLQKFAERKAESIVSDIIANGSTIFTESGDLTISLPPQASKNNSDFTISSPVSIFDGTNSESLLGAETDQSVGSLSKPVTEAETKTPVVNNQPPPAQVNYDPVINANFLEWAATYSGPKFSLIHCDFPYGNYKGGDSQGSLSGTEVESFYDNHESIYWDLLTGLIDNLDRIMSYSAHLVFWFNMNFYTETVRRLRGAGLMVHDHPLIWHKTPGGGGGLGVVPGTATTYPRRTYDTALLAVRGNRPLAKPGMNSYAAPTAGNKIHPSQKPEPMLRHFLSMVVDETTTVLDPTCGSAAALRAAEDLGAKFVLGLELDPNYAATANTRTLQARVMRQMGAIGRGDE